MLPQFLTRCARILAATSLLLLLPPHATLAAADTLPPTHSATHTIVVPNPATTATPILPLTDLEIAATHRPLAFQNPDGSFLASDRVNAITCRAPAESDESKTAVEWLGTQMGVKAVDRAHGVVAHYTQRDGLPADYVEAITVSGRGNTAHIYCLIRTDPTEQLALCELDIASHTGHWTTLATIDASVRGSTANFRWRVTDSDAWYVRWGKSHLAVMPDGRVIVAPSAIDAHAIDSLIYVWDRKTSTLTPIPEDATLKADTTILGVNDLAVTGQTACLATTVGLLYCDLTVANASASVTPTWHRTLPDQQVDALICAPPDHAAPDAERIVYAACRERPYLSRGVSDESGQPITKDREDVPLTRNDFRRQTRSTYQLIAFHSRTGTVEKLPLRPAPFGMGQPYIGEDITQVEAIARGTDGALYLTARTRMTYTEAYIEGGSGFSRYDPVKGTWIEYRLNGQLQEPFNNPQTPPVTVPPIPSEAMMPLAFSLHLGGEGPRDWGREGSSLLSPLTWAIRCFPHWLCPASEDVRKADAQRITLGDPPSDSRHEWQIDPENPRVLVHANPKSPTERYTFHGGIQQIAPSVTAVATQAVSSNILVVESRSGIYRLTDNPATRTPSWQRLNNALDTTLVGVDGVSSPGRAFHTARTVRLGPDLRLFAAVYSEKYLERYDKAKGRFVKTDLRIPPFTDLLGGGVHGLWFQNGNRRYFAAIHPDPKSPNGFTLAPPQLIDLTFPPTLPIQVAEDRSELGVSDTTLWFTKELYREPASFPKRANTFSAVIGYDALRRRWTAPLEVRTGFNDRIWPAQDGTTYAICEYDGVVSRYDPTRNAWTPATIQLPADSQTSYTESASPQVIGVDSRDIYVADGTRLMRYDRQANVWETHALPEILHTGKSDLSRPVGVMTSAALWLGDDRGLWRYDRARRTWAEMLHPFSFDPPTLSQPVRSVSLEIAGVDARTVWGFANSERSRIFRFDRATHQFSVYARSPYNAESPNQTHLWPDGDSVWEIGEQSASCLNLKTGLFKCYFGNHVPANTPTAPPGVSLAHILSITNDPATPDTSCLLVGYPLPPDGALNQNTVDQTALLYRFHHKTGQIEPLPIDAATLKNAQTHWQGAQILARVPSLNGTGGLLLEKDRLWVGTSLGVLWRNNTTGAWSLATLPAGAPPRMSIENIYTDSTGTIWVTDKENTLRIPKADTAH